MESVFPAYHRRAAAAPLYGRTPQRWTVLRLIKALGPAVSLRLSLTPERGMSGTAPIRRLWMRAIATASAARLLAAGQAGQGPLEQPPGKAQRIEFGGQAHVDLVAAPQPVFAFDFTVAG